ncbi:hypothetical protein RINTU1_18640 [Candidatus Regiella insecticola]|uniref:Uncharacterized protein n=1 Tax=Candidatus Regiella insecticola TaxID=138073 RepID=A0A6L2ZNF0_9ENTR|nr:hypothetical protein RINTU1_18640 [Candidatus Regiella insecticola]
MHLDTCESYTPWGSSQILQLSGIGLASAKIGIENNNIDNIFKEIFIFFI